MNLLEQYKDLYYHEIEQSSRLNRKIANNITFLSILGVGTIYLWGVVATLEPQRCHVLLILFMSIATILFFVTIGLFCWAHTGYKYIYFPIEEVRLQVENNLKHAENSNCAKTKSLVDTNIERIFAEVYVSSAIQNQKQNEIKTYRQRILMHWVIITFIPIVVAFGVYTAFNIFS